MKFVIDTSILIDHLRGGKTWKNFLVEIKGEDISLSIPTIVIFELFSGKSTQNSYIVNKIAKLLKNFQQIELDERIAKRAGMIYRDISKTLQVPDYLVAASALEVGATVLTLNRKHFQEIPNLSLYPLENGEN